MRVSPNTLYLGDDVMVSRRLGAPMAGVVVSLRDGVVYCRMVTAGHRLTIGAAWDHVEGVAEVVDASE